MTIKKIIISVVAILAIIAALLSVWHWQNKTVEQPTRQEMEIR